MVQSKPSEDAKAALAAYRSSIDNIDAALVHMLAERFRCTKAVGELKAAHGLPPADPQREQQQIARLRRLANEASLDPDFAENFLNFIIKEVIRHHEKIAAGGGATATARGAS
jgi:chorismate mutase